MNLDDYAYSIRKRLAQPHPEYLGIATELVGASKMAHMLGHAEARKTIGALHSEVLQAWRNNEEA